MRCQNKRILECVPCFSTDDVIRNCSFLLVILFLNTNQLGFERFSEVLTCGSEWSALLTLAPSVRMSSNRRSTRSRQPPPPSGGLVNRARPSMTFQASTSSALADATDEEEESYGSESLTPLSSRNGSLQPDFFRTSSRSDLSFEELGNDSSTDAEELIEEQTVHSTCPDIPLNPPIVPSSSSDDQLSEELSPELDSLSGS